jgi:hypothetical protein
MEHDLLLIGKGFRLWGGWGEYTRLLEGRGNRLLQVADIGYDIRPYRLAVRRFDYNYFCFLNSNSILLDRDWLRKLFLHASAPDVGVTGATGSWASAYSGFVLHQQAIFEREARTGLTVPMYKRVWRAWLRYKCRGQFHPFPNYHIRTNAFLIRGDLMRQIECGLILSKKGAWRFESGKNSLTWQILRRGLRAVVVGKDGKGYDKEDWFRSNTLWQRNQENLLVADRRTDEYTQANAQRRQELSAFAWGDKANPCLDSH